jgi:hypothetical protein
MAGCRLLFSELFEHSKSNSGLASNFNLVLHFNIASVKIDSRRVNAMDVARTQKYLSEILHQELCIEPYKSKLQNMPPFLLGEFEHYTVRIIDTDILLLWRKNSDAISPALLKKRIAAAVDGWNGPVCVGLDKITAYTRKQLIETC